MQAGTEQGWACTRVAGNAGGKTRQGEGENTRGQKDAEGHKSDLWSCACPGRDATPKGRTLTPCRVKRKRRKYTHADQGSSVSQIMTSKEGVEEDVVREASARVEESLRLKKATDIQPFRPTINPF